MARKTSSTSKSRPKEGCGSLKESRSENTSSTDRRHKKRTRWRAKPSGHRKPPIRLAALEEAPDGKCFAEVRCPNLVGHEQSLFIALSTFNDSRQLRRILLDAGVDEELVAGFLKGPRKAISEIMNKRKRVDSPGWHKFDQADPVTYLWPDKKSKVAPEGYSSAVFRRDGEVPNCPLEPVGTVKDWRRKVAGPASKSPAATLAIGLAFAALVLRFASVGNFTVQLIGPTTSGKTFLLELSSSVCGFIPRDRMTTWNITPIAAEELAATANDNICPIDELALADESTRASATVMVNNVFRFASGHTRRRARSYEREYEPVAREYRTIVVTSAVRSLYELCERMGLRYDRGEIVRWAAVPIVEPETNTIFLSLPDDCDRADEAIGQVREACTRHSGKVGRKFVHKVLAEDEIEDRVAKLIAKFNKAADVPDEPMERRFAAMFALPYAGLMLAIEWGLFPKCPNRAGNHLIKLYRRTHAHLPTVENTLKRDLATLQEALGSGDRMAQLSRKGRRTIVVDEDLAESKTCFGFVESTDGHADRFWIKPSALEQLLGSDDRARNLMRHLRYHDLLLQDKGKPNQLVIERQIGSLGRAYYYIVKRGDLDV